MVKVIFTKRLKAYILLLLTLLSVGLNAFTLHASLASSTVNTVLLSPIADAFVDMEYPERNYGKDPYLNVRVRVPGYWIRRSYLKFDLTELPADVVIKEAKLHLYRLGGDRVEQEVGVYTVSPDWEELYINWMNAPLDFVFVSSLLVSAPDGWKTFDVTQAAQEAYATADKILSLAVKFVSEWLEQHQNFVSRENVEEHKRPFLEVTYEIPPVTYFLTVTASPDEVLELQPTFYIRWILGGVLRHGWFDVPHTFRVDAGTWANVSNPQSPVDNYYFQYYDPSDKVFMDSNKTVTLVYKRIVPKKYTLTVTASPEGALGGSFYIEWIENGKLKSGTFTTSYSFTCDEGTYANISNPQSPINNYHFQHFKVDEVVFVDKVVRVFMDSDKTVTLVYVYIEKFCLTVETNGLPQPGFTNVYINGTVVGIAYDESPWTGWFTKSTLINLDVDSPVYYDGVGVSFIEWRGDYVGTVRPAVFHIEQNMTVIAVYMGPVEKLEYAKEEKEELLNELEGFYNNSKIYEHVYKHLVKRLSYVNREIDKAISCWNQADDENGYDGSDWRAGMMGFNHIRHAVTTIEELLKYVGAQLKGRKIHPDAAEAIKHKLLRIKWKLVNAAYLKAWTAIKVAEELWEEGEDEVNEWEKPDKWLKKMFIHWAEMALHKGVKFWEMRRQPPAISMFKVAFKFAYRAVNEE